MLGKPRILSIFPISFNEFNRTSALMLGPLHSILSENYPYVLSHGVTTLNWHAQLIAISAGGDGDEVGVSFKGSPLSFETDTEIRL